MKSKPICMSIFCLCCLYSAENIEFDTVDVVTKHIREDKEVFKNSKASSVRQDISTSTKSIEDIIRSVPGAFVNEDKSSGGVAVNVRGGTGFGKVNVMIDGVPQTFYATSADLGGKSGGTSQFGANIDQNFLSSVNIEKGSFTGLSGTNALLGSTNFKTIDVDDIVATGKNFGFMTKTLFGTNAIEPYYMGATGLRYELPNGAYLGGIYAYSKKKTSQEYKVGGGKRISDIAKEDMDRLKEHCVGGQGGFGDCDEDELKTIDTTPFDAKALKQRPVSHLAKVSYVGEYNSLSFQYRKYDTFLAKRSILNNLYQFDYGFDYNNLININLSYANSVGKQQYQPGVFITGREVYKFLEAKNETNNFNVSNSLELDLTDQINFKTTPGINLLKVKYSKNRHPYELDIFLDDDEDAGIRTDDDLRDSIRELIANGRLDKLGSSNPLDFRQNFKAPVLFGGSTTFQPDAKARYKTLYLDNSLQLGLMTLNYNINYQKFKYTGKHNKLIDGEYYAYEDYFGEEEAKKYINESPDADGDNSPYCWRDQDDGDVYCNNLNVTTNSSGKKHAFNYSFLLSANIHELFTPFVGVSKTHRMPNIKEMFFSPIGSLGINTALKPERAKTRQLGVNGFKDNLFLKNDSLGFKVVYFKTHIDNYIHNVFGYPKHAGLATSNPMIQHQNYKKGVNLRGVELELSYDTGMFYANLAYARQKSNQPTSYSDVSPKVKNMSKDEQLGQGFGLTKISLLPKDYGHLDVGGRFFNKKLTIGSTARYYGKSYRAVPNNDIDIGDRSHPVCQGAHSGWKCISKIRGIQEIQRQPFIFDFYLSYEPIKDLIIKAELQNAFDKKYINPLDSNNDSANQDSSIIGSDNEFVLNNFARGRTAILSMSYKF